jgi:hypothetical protein
LIDESSTAYGSTVANIQSNELQFRNNIISGTSSTGGFAKDIEFVFNGARSLTPTTSNSDTTATGTDWSTLAGVDGPWTWLKATANHNTIYATEQTGVRLGNPFNLSNPGMIPTSTSPVVYSSTSSTPATPPDFVNNKSSDAFFTPVGYIGAFAGTGSTSDNWMHGWCEFNPNYANYDVACLIVDTTTSSVTTIGNSGFSNVKVFPNPASDVASVMMDVMHAGTVKINVMDMTGKTVLEVYNGIANAGTQTFEFNTSKLSNGVYVVSIVSDSKQKTLKFSVAK